MQDSANPIYSTLATDEDLGDLVTMFVDEMPGRIQALESQAEDRNWVQLTCTAHQLKGAAGSYGFHDITPSARTLEMALRQHQPEAEILAALAEVLDLCRRARAGTP